MRRCVIALALVLPAVLPAQSSTGHPTPDGVMLSFQRFADIYGGWLVAAFDSIPESRYEYRPMPVQRSIGNIAQHLEHANYALCERFASTKHARTAKDSLADSVKSRWPKDTLVARLKASLDYCDKASVEFHVTLENGALYIEPNTGGPAVPLWPESSIDFFVKKVDAQTTFTRDANGKVNGFVLHQYGRDRPTKKIG